MGRLTAFIGGRVEVLAKGCQLESFLTLLYRGRLHPYRPLPTEDGALRFSLPVREFKKLRAPAFKTGTRIRILKKRGLYRAIRPFKRRLGLAVGMALFMGIVYYSSGFIWQVEVRGCEQTSYTEILADLEPLGLYVGCRQTLKVNPIENRYLTNNDKISWMSINIRGTTAYVDIKEKDLTPKVIDVSVPSNIVAARDGKIVTIRDYGGTRQVEVGSAVRAGDLLVSGDWTDQYGVRRLSKSVATVVAETRRETEITVPLTETYRKKTGKTTKKFTLSLGKFKIPLYFSEKISYNKYNIVEQTDQLSIGSFAFPIRYHCVTAEEVEEITNPRTVEQARAAAMAELAFYQADRLAQVKVLRREVEEISEDGLLTLRVVFYCEEEIGMEVPIKE